MKRWNPQEYSLVYDTKCSFYHITHLDANRWKALGAILKKNNLSFEEMEQLQKICELVSEKNLLKKYSFPKYKWKMLLECENETKDKVNDLSSE